MAKLLVLHGPNLNLLGTREPAIYGSTTLADIDADLRGTDFIVINPAAFTHTSVALRDALAAVAVPFIEVHLSNPHAREPFRHTSYFSDLAVGVISGFGADSYRYALDAALARLPIASNASTALPQRRGR